jgi:hypothetical protein
MMVRVLHWQGIAGIAVALVLTVMLTVQKLEALRWKKQSDQFEQLHNQERAAFAVTVANARTAADAARGADRANAERVAAEQRQINERINDDFEARVAHARARAAAAERLRLNAEGPANSRTGASAAMPDVPAPAGDAAQAPHKDGLPATDRLIATEQAIQLDALIRWVRQQHAVRMDAATAPEPRSLQQ